MHRDVKLENLLLASEGTCKLGDFGMAIPMQVGAPTAWTGTLDYMAPEVCAGSCSFAVQAADSLYTAVMKSLMSWSTLLLCALNHQLPHPCGSITDLSRGGTPGLAQLSKRRWKQACQPEPALSCCLLPCSRVQGGG